MTEVAEASTTAEPERLAVGTILADRYKLQRLLGEGGMGAVYLAEHVLMRKRCAIKVLHREIASSEILARFKSEAIAAANIGHPNIAAATDFGELPDGSFFLVLEYVAGDSLRKALQDGALPVARALRIARGVLSALGAAHEKGVTHRDIKPENIMLLEGAADDRVKVLDFGIAKLDDGALSHDQGRGLTRMGAIYGTPEYMSPEQATGRAVDGRTDLYAVGIMLFEMIAGRLPFQGGEVVEILAQHVTKRPPPLTSPRAPADVTTAVEELVSRLLSKVPDERPRDAAEAIALIDEALASLPTEREAPTLAPPAVAPEPLTSTSWSRLEEAVAPMSRRIGLAPSALLRAVVVGIGVSLLLLAVVIALPSRHSDEGDDHVARRPRVANTAPASVGMPSVSASVVAVPSSSASAVTSGTTAPSGSASTATTSVAAAPAPKKKTSSSPVKDLGSKIKSLFK